VDRIWWHAASKQTDACAHEPTRRQTEDLNKKLQLHADSPNQPVDWQQRQIQLRWLQLKHLQSSWRLRQQVLPPQLLPAHLQQPGRWHQLHHLRLQRRSLKRSQWPLPLTQDLRAGGFHTREGGRPVAGLDSSTQAQAGLISGLPATKQQSKEAGWQTRCSRRTLRTGC
jgi:hypothetical protein